MADHQNCTGVAAEIIFQPLHGGKVEMVGGLVQNQDVRLFQQQLGNPQPGQLAARQNTYILGPGVLRESHASQHLFDIHIHIIAISGIHHRLQGSVLLQQGRIRLHSHFLFQHLHLRHGIQYRRKGRAHFTVDIQRSIQFGVLGQIPQRDAVGQAELAAVVGVFPGQDLQEGGLARAVLAHNADAVLPLDAGRHVLQHDLFPKGLADMFQIHQHRFLPHTSRQDPEYSARNPQI